MDETYTLTVYGTAECEMTMKAVGLIVPLLISFPAARGLTYPLACSYVYDLQKFTRKHQFETSLSV